MGYNKELSINEYPSQEDMDEADQVTNRKPGISGRVMSFAKGRGGKGVAAVTGLGLLGLLVSNCAPQAQAEVRPAESPSSEFKDKVVFPEVQAKQEEAVNAVAAPEVQNTPIVIEQYKPPTITFEEMKTLYGQEYPVNVSDRDLPEGIYYWSGSDERVVLVWGKVKETKEVERTRVISDGFTMTDKVQMITLIVAGRELTFPIAVTGAYTADVVDSEIKDATSTRVPGKKVVERINVAGNKPRVDARVDFTKGSPEISFVGIYTRSSSR